MFDLFGKCLFKVCWSQHDVERENIQFAAYFVLLKPLSIIHLLSF